MISDFTRRFQVVVTASRDHPVKFWERRTTIPHRPLRSGYFVAVCFRCGIRSNVRMPCNSRNRTSTDGGPVRGIPCLVISPVSEPRSDEAVPAQCSRYRCRQSWSTEMDIGMVSPLSKMYGDLKLRNSHLLFVIQPNMQERWAEPDVGDSQATVAIFCFFIL
ncbi:hypothetical protein BDV96DRAFT_345491 [Lophiotrema nucula]|uniref:Uncharacterized protein n=1 Tax=Lophiotrema nucula TaxID=690887 RepID=A0A6A5ZIT5_9PLEO|nr:hypothetical protein BDV96DRAFT_345491 [Lophiotrema nucula]